MSNVRSAMFLLGLSLLVLGANSKVVDFIDPCPLNGNDCLLTSAKKAMAVIKDGIPDLDIHSVDPMYIKDVDASNGSLNLLFPKLTVTGIGKCNILKLTRSDKLKANLKVECPITVIGTYKMWGKCFDLAEIEGEGDCRIVSEKNVVDIFINLKTILKDNTEYYKVDKFTYEYDPIGEVDFVFDNLYNGDKPKAEAVSKIIKDLAKVFMNTWGKPVITEIFTKCIRSVNKLFNAVPAHELELQ